MYTMLEKKKNIESVCNLQNFAQYIDVLWWILDFLDLYWFWLGAE